MSSIPALAEYAVRQSASMLDQISPDWWVAERVNLDTLAIESGSNCLLAQSFGRIEPGCTCCPDSSYSAGLGAVEGLLRDAGMNDEGSDFSTRRGFAGGYVDVDREIFPDCKDDRVFIASVLFTAPWVKVIRERRDAANDPLMTLINEAS